VPGTVDATALLVLCAVAPIRMRTWGLLSLRTLSIGLSIAATLMGAALALTAPQTGSQGTAPQHPLDATLVERGLHSGSPVLIRIFKQESELELWMAEGDRFVLVTTYPICFWSGKLGPKEREGDKQAPEGFYSVGLSQLRHVGRHPRSFNIGFPNGVDRALGRTGSYILVHGGCTSIGCFAMTDAVMDELYNVAEQALGTGQDAIQVQIFPFRMRDEAMAAHVGNKWYDFWRNLKEGYDAFEQTHVPPSIAACGGKYLISNRELVSDYVPPTPESCNNTPPIVTARAPLAPHLQRRMAGSRALAHAIRHHSVGARVGLRQVRLAHSSHRVRVR
jgi:murein L,D-transpeptidase YafK